MDAENPRAIIGDNEPPEATPFDLSVDEIDTLWIEAENFLDGEPLSDQGQADAVAKLLDLARQAIKTAEDRRKAEAKPLDDAKAEIQARYHGLIGDTKDGKGKAVLIVEACKRVTTVWLVKRDNEKRKAERVAREVAEAARQAAAAAFETSHSDDVGARMRAEALDVEAKAAERAAGRAEKDKAQAKGGARAVTLQTSYEPVLVDAKSAARHAWTNWKPELDAFLVEMAKRDFRRSVYTIPGFEAKEVRSAR